MKKIITKLIVVAMVITTVVIPVDFSVAESLDGQKEIVTEQSNGMSTNDESKDGVSVDHQGETLEQQNDINEANAISEETEQLVTEEMNFLYIESPQLVAPGTQNLVVSWEDSIDEIIKMVLLYENSKGEQFELEEKERTDKSILFTKDFSAGEIGAYIIKGVKYYVGEEEEYFAFDDIGIDADFEVVSGPQDSSADENITIIENSSDSVNSSSVKKQVEQALSSADVDISATQNSRAAAGNVVVVLDPGHGDNDPGATYGDLREKNLNLQIAQACYNELSQYGGVTVYMTRYGDTPNLSLEGRAQVAQNYNADVLISIHNNSGSGTGFEIWKPNQNYNWNVYTTGTNLSSSILKELEKLGLTNRGMHERNSETNTHYYDNGVDKGIADYYGIIKHCKMRGITGIIIEHAFLKTADYAYLSNPNNLTKLGIADATGIANYFGLSKGKWITEANGNKYYQYSDGHYATGYTWINNGYYYFDANGKMLQYDQMIYGQPYYFDWSGKAASKGWITYPNGDKKYCIGNGKLATGYWWIGDGYRYFDANGKMSRYDQMIYGQPYYFDWSGKAMSKGWLTYKNGDKKYCVGNGKLATGYWWIGDGYRYFDANGKMLRYDQTINGQPYYFDWSGKAMSKGWLTYKNGDKKYCVGNGKLATGYWWIGDGYRYFDANGKMLRYDQTIYGQPYYFDWSGKAMSIGWLTYKNGAKKYCVGNGKLATGTITIGNTRYNFNSNGFLISQQELFTSIAGKTTVTASQLERFYNNNSPITFPQSSYNMTLKEFCEEYIEEANAEDIRAEVAFCQAMHETGWLQFKGDVKIGQYNFAGLGATGNGASGATFSSVEVGIRAQIQHLKAYATQASLNRACVDDRFKYVQRGCAPFVEWLGQKENPNGKGWATDLRYGYYITDLMTKLSNTSK